MHLDTGKHMLVPRKQDWLGARPLCDPSMLDLSRTQNTQRSDWLINWAPYTKNKCPLQQSSFAPNLQTLSCCNTEEENAIKLSKIDRFG